MIKITSLAAAALAFAALLPTADAQAQAAKQPARIPAAAAAPQQPPAAPPFVPCQNAEEVCYLGIVVGSQVLVVYTNAPNAAGLEKPIDVTGPDNAKIDLARNAGRVVMLTGTLDPNAGLTKAELVEVAGPLQSLAIKAQLAGGPPEEPAAAAKGAAPRRR